MFAKFEFQLVAPKFSFLFHCSGFHSTSTVFLLPNFGKVFFKCVSKQRANALYHRHKNDLTFKPVGLGLIHVKPGAPFPLIKPFHGAYGGDDDFHPLAQSSHSSGLALREWKQNLFSVCSNFPALFQTVRSP